MHVILYVHDDRTHALQSLIHLIASYSANKFSQAIVLYSKAIELNGLNAVYWANRAFAHTKLEEYGSAVQDASKAIEIDPRYSKVRKFIDIISCSF